MRITRSLLTRQSQDSYLTIKHTVMNKKKCVYQTHISKVNINY